MKKVLFLTASIALVSLASCKKDRTCKCTSGNYTTEVTYTKATKRAAKTNCLSYETTSGSTTTKVDCSLK